MIYNPKTWRGYVAVRRHILEFAIAWLLFIGVILTYNYLSQLERDRAPITDYFEVRQIGVPDFPLGTNPVIIYDRSVNKAFRGSYTVEVQEAGTLQPLPECTGSAEVNYDPDKQLPVGGPTLFWFIGHSCIIPIGSYRIEACWDIHRDRATEVHYCKPSAIFSVFDPSSPPQKQAPTQE